MQVLIHFLRLYNDRLKYIYHYCLKNCACRPCFLNSEVLKNYIIRTSGCGAHTVSCTIGIRSFPRVKRPGFGINHPPRLTQKLKKGYSHISTSNFCLRGRLQSEIYLCFLCWNLFAQVNFCRYCVKSCFRIISLPLIGDMNSKVNSLSRTKCGPSPSPKGRILLVKNVITTRSMILDA